MFLITNSTFSNTILSSTYLIMVFLEKKLPLLPIAASPDHHEPDSPVRPRQNATWHPEPELALMAR